MSMEIRGLNELHARLDAISGPRFGRPFMEWVARQTVREAALRVAVRSHTTQRSIHIAAVTDDSATITVSAAGPLLEFGTKAHIIRAKPGRSAKNPSHAHSLGWGGATTLGGRRRIVKGVMVSPTNFAMSVHHPGTKPRPFLVPAAKAVFTAAGLKEATVKAWNGAA